MFTSFGVNKNITPIIESKTAKTIAITFLF